MKKYLVEAKHHRDKNSKRQQVFDISMMNFFLRSLRSASRHCPFSCLCRCSLFGHRPPQTIREPIMAGSRLVPVQLFRERRLPVPRRYHKKRCIRNLCFIVFDLVENESIIYSESWSAYSKFKGLFIKLFGNNLFARLNIH